jgi:carbon storage regulator
MLILSRKKNEAVIITVGDQRIRVTLVAIRGDKVRLGFDASKTVTIHRTEIQERVDAESAAIMYDPTIGEDYA